MRTPGGTRAAERLGLQPGDSSIAAEVDGRIVLSPGRREAIRQEFEGLMAEFDRALRGLRLLSAILGSGHSQRLLATLLDTAELVVSDAILAELDEVLRTEARLARRVPARLRGAQVTLLSRGVRLVGPRPVEGLRGSGDTPIAGTALAARATLVTGDKELRESTAVTLRTLSVREALVELGLAP